MKRREDLKIKKIKDEKKKAKVLQNKTSWSLVHLSHQLCYVIIIFWFFCGGV